MTVLHRQVMSVVPVSASNEHWAQVLREPSVVATPKISSAPMNTAGTARAFKGCTSKKVVAGGTNAMLGSAIDGPGEMKCE
jgi:hypothetical protein